MYANMRINISSLRNMPHLFTEDDVNYVMKHGRLLGEGAYELTMEQAEHIRKKKSIALPSQLPSNWQMFKNLVGAAADAVKGGLDVRGPEETEAILAICAKCPKLVTDDRGLRCGSCGCWLGGFNPNGSRNLGKVSLRVWGCPEGKW